MNYDSEFPVFYFYKFTVTWVNELTETPQLQEAEVISPQQQLAQERENKLDVLNGIHFAEFDQPRLKIFAERLNRFSPLFSYRMELFSREKKSTLDRLFRALLSKHSDMRYAHPKLCSDIIVLMDYISKAKTAQGFKHDITQESAYLKSEFFEKFGMSREQICRLLDTRRGDPTQTRSTTHARISTEWEKLRIEMYRKKRQERLQREKAEYNQVGSDDESDVLDQVPSTLQMSVG